MKDCNICFRIDEELKTALAEMAKEKDIPLSQFIREAVKWYMSQFNNKEN